MNKSVKHEAIPIWFYHGKRFITFLSGNSELILWISALVFLFFYQPGVDTHFTICPLKNLGFDYCPGCGLGGAISYLLHMDFKNSFASHPLGFAAFFILIYRIIQLLAKSRNNLIIFKEND